MMKWLTVLAILTASLASIPAKEITWRQRSTRRFQADRNAPLQTIAYASLEGIPTQMRVTVLETDDPQEADKLIPSNYIAKAVYSNQINETGWAFLEVETNTAAGDIKQARGAGVVEGYLTAHILQMHVRNVGRPFCDGRQALCRNIQRYLDTNVDWMRMQVLRKAESDPYWYQVALFFTQEDGLLEGYNIRQTEDPYLKDISTNDLLWLNVQGDLEDLVTALAPNKQTQMENGRVLGSGSCSALIKLLPDYSDIFVSQDTWSSYETMLRIQKKYILNYNVGVANAEPLPGRSMSFSSYPGVLTSGDDFYITSSGLVTLETTIGNGNSDLWQYVKPRESVVEGARSMVANRLAKNGSHWADIFSRYNSGTYNNQWMVVDLKQFSRGKQPTRGLLQVLEQLPGLITSQDLTPHLVSSGYFASYNVPFFPEVFNMSGNTKLVEKFGDWFTYDKCPRARIFRRDQSTVKDLNSMWKLMRSNDFLNDPLSVCNCTPTHNGENAIAARSDLNPAKGTYPWGALGHRNHGATDTKITTLDLANDLRFLGESGPPHYSPSCPPFSWSTADFAATTPHEGLPDKWTFPPVTHEWAWDNSAY